jgi:hypothetical protein
MRNEAIQGRLILEQFQSLELSKVDTGYKLYRFTRARTDLKEWHVT